MPEITHIKLTGLTCSACQKLIEKRLKAIDGVKEVKVAPNGNTEITASRVIESDEIAKQLADTDFKLVNK